MSVLCLHIAPAAPQVATQKKIKNSHAGLILWGA